MWSGIRRTLALTFALGAAVALTPAASASTAKIEVEVVVFNKGDYTAHLCGLDWLGGYCHSGVKSGESTTFTVYPRSHEDLVWSRVVVDKGGSAYAETVAAGDEVCFVAAGVAEDPTLEAVECE
ncbi:hypothetical protein FKR81_13500 [Lentzea tibetensis]|uniref:Secreted protein n=1 Tax=Lentzea tibetensis TaxID=2591470 RepID=A0A563EVY1_9PSEU|nr:hypothetical protein [Lentzea tibetensis]TWP51860.1 hypothetical protein FKR81_13500 [Lentzea tibetensis]